MHFRLLRCASSTGARYPGNCSAPIKGVYHEGFCEDDYDILVPHACYVYRLLHGLNIRGEDTNMMFARLLERCKNGDNYPACPIMATLASEDEVRTLHSVAYSGLTLFRNRSWTTSRSRALVARLPPKCIGLPS